LSDVVEELSAQNIEAVKVDLTKPLREQGPFDGILHKLTDLIAQADLGNKEALVLIKNLETYSLENPGVIVIDPIDCLRTVIDRYKTYATIHDLVSDDETFVPPFVALRSNNLSENVELFRESKVTFPCVSKPIVAHGSSSAHEMTLVFNEKGLAECAFPCVVQSFINHNAVLYKLFALGDTFAVVERPSIRNLTASEDMKPIHFHSDDVSKPSSCSQLTFQENREELSENRIPCQKSLARIVQQIHKVLGLGLFGVDVVVDSSSRRLAIIDVNSFPGYDGIENFPGKLAAFVRSELDALDREITFNCSEVGTPMDSNLINPRS
jgi:inositol-1,3,4-trisphosphate 5/6-kinase/inositol-tetrakisphosphate 1-kinase